MEERVPEIRFKGFEGPWNKNNASDIGIYSKGRGYSKNDLAKEGTPIILYGRLYTNYQFSINEVDTYAVPKENSVYSFGNEVIIPASGETAEDIARAAAVEQQGVLLGGDLNIIRTYSSFNPAFIALNISTGGNQKELASKAQGKSVVHIHNSDVQELVFFIPTLQEQTYITDMFQNLDTLITLTQQKLDQLKTLKKACLEKMFPKEGETVPEIRFKGFEEAWEKKCFSDITYFSGEKNRDNLPLESYSITNEDGFIPQNEKFENGGTMRTADKSMYYIVSPQSFAYNPARINVGSIGYHNQNKNVIVSSLYEVFKTTDNVDDRFLWHWFKSNSFQHLIEQLQEGGVRLYFYYDKLCQGKIALPSVDEQHLIGSYLDRLDMILLQYQQKLDKLKNLKKALLDKMFV